MTSVVDSLEERDYKFHERQTKLGFCYDIIHSCRQVGHVEVGDLVISELMVLPEKYQTGLMLFNLQVKPLHRRRGLGSFLVDRAKEYASRQGRFILLHPDSKGRDPIDHQDLLKFYARNGFHGIDGDNPFGYLEWNGGQRK
jgi:GNAT superfamily N-acetyltransferase